MNDTKQIKLGFSMRGLGYHASAWLDPDVPADGHINLHYYIEMVKTAERGLFDMVFFADQTGMRFSNTPNGALGRTAAGAEFEPITLLAALSQSTSHLGLAATASTTFHAPFQLARQFSSLDHLSGGRVAWNVVTSSRDEEARNFGDVQILEKNKRYERAQEALKVAFALWDSWEDDAFVRDRQSGVFFDPAKVHPPRHEGTYFRVHGPLTLPRTPQGRPVIIQAGSSDDGVALAGATADVVYALQTTLPEARAFRSRIRDCAASNGRDPDSIKVMPGILPILGDSQEAADARYRRMQEELDPLIGLENLSPYFGDLSGYDLDGPVPGLRTDRPVISRGEKILEMARAKNLTIRQLFQSTAIGNGHHVVVGTAEKVADVMEAWFREGAADGFNVLPAKSPAGLDEFVEKVIPELQRRGLFRKRYEGRTLRENLGLPPSISRWAAGSAPG